MASRSNTVSMLADLVGARVVNGSDPLVQDVTHDSRQVARGSLYVAIRGEHADGHSFVGSATASGAVAVCVDHEVATDVPQIVVEDTRAVLGELAAAVYDYPSTAVDVIGVTGTNGKTTVTHYVESIARHAGLSTGLVGTIATRSGSRSAAASLTTPEASEFQRLLAGMRDDGVDLVAAEVSSHALVYGRVRGTRFAVVAFTNISQDHLDFHGDMEAYRTAKKRLFTDYQVGTAVVNIDDPTGAEIARDFGGDLITVGGGGDFSVHSVETHSSYSSFTIETPEGRFHRQAPVIGEFNVSNLVLAAACCVAADIDPEIVFEAVMDVAAVPGRFEVVSGDDPITVIVDYAHTPQGVETAVDTGRRLAPGRVIALLGAGGDRDRRKRPAMGAALAGADLAIVTSDNPRSEDPEQIARAVLSGIDGESEHVLEIDRRRAIDLAIDSADDGDVVLILGRGHEPNQDLGSEKVRFDDREVAAASLRRRRSAGFGSGSGSMST
ncbi:MAG: UDP-N-acetylmuramoyl-L-alanyl-D-glutamate--2,6-diaminopimelate ligase [Actinomycetota bacterium]